MRIVPLAVFAASLSLGLPAAVHAERAPATMGQDARVRRVNYNPTDVIRIDTNLLVNTAIELGAGERINQVLVGDSESFQIVVLENRNTVSIKPVVARAATNMTLYTNRRAIAFALTEGRSQTPTYRALVVFPDERAAKPQLVAGGRDTGYRYANDGAIRPVRVWNDGRSTFFEFARGVRPSVFGLNGSGYEVTLNSATRGTIVRVAGVRPAYTVRMGKEYVCITHVADGYTSDPRVVDALRQREF